jgi:opacity protein-like surface antigen
MKKLPILSTAILIGLLAGPLQAGTEVYKQVAAPPPVYAYGLGFYGAIDGGANVYQNRGGDRSFSVDNDGDSWDRDQRLLGTTLDVNPKNDVGFFGGVKLGYVFGSGVVRPTVEGDFFYNGFRGGADLTLNEAFTPCPGCPTELSTHQRNVNTWINTGAFMANFILRLAPGNQRFQPYAGAGIGVYYAESAGVEVVDPVTGRVPVNTGGGASHADLAWQIIAGTDYYWTPKFSTFIEYKFLNYTSTQIDTREDRDLRQHLVGAGVRFHF